MRKRGAMRSLLVHVVRDNFLPLGQTATFCKIIYFWECGNDKGLTTFLLGCFTNQKWSRGSVLRKIFNDRRERTSWWMRISTFGDSSRHVAKPFVSIFYPRSWFSFSSCVPNFLMVMIINCGNTKKTLSTRQRITFLIKLISIIYYVVLREISILGAGIVRKWLSMLLAKIQTL